MKTYEKHLFEPWFSLIKIGKKNVEGRINKGDFAIMEKGDIIIFQNNDFGFMRKIMVEITETRFYNSFKEYLTFENLSNCLPSIDTIEEGEYVYYNFYKKEDEISFGVKAFQLVLIEDL